MPTPTPPSIDYRALIQDRKAKQTRAVVRHILCLVPELFTELEELQDEQRLASYSSTSGETKPPANQRMAGGPTSVSTRITELEAQIEAASVVGVFKAPSAERQAELNRVFADSDDVVGHTIQVILDAFTHFEASREPIPAEQLGRADLAELLPVMAQGELLALGNRIVEASAGAPDLPLSVQRSLLNRRSGATSKPR